MQINESTDFRAFSHAGLRENHRRDTRVRQTTPSNICTRLVRP
jgi:hypothetical protein